MADAKQLKVKIQSTNNIKKITNALEIISTLKLQKVKKSTMHLRDCMTTLIDMIASIDSYDGLFTQTPLHTATKDLVIVIGTEKGLCGSLNTALFKYVHGKYDGQQSHIDVYAVGKKTREYFQRRGYTITHTTYLGDVISHDMCHDLLDVVDAARKTGIYTSITICYNIFKNTMKYIPVAFPLFPLHGVELQSFLQELHRDDTKTVTTTISEPLTHKTSLLIEPSSAIMRDAIYKMLMQYVIYGSILQNKTCEFASRMLAMKGAKDNATTQIRGLTLAFNKARQDAITREIIEVVGAKSVIE